MKILIVGQGAREHALGWKFKAENPKHEVFFSPGNAGTALTGKNLLLPIRHPGESRVPDLNLDSGLRRNDELEIAKKIKPDLTVIGPEAPLAAGLSDDLNALGFKAFGTGKQAARQMVADETGCAGDQDGHADSLVTGLGYRMEWP